MVESRDDAAQSARVTSLLPGQTECRLSPLPKVCRTSRCTSIALHSSDEWGTMTEKDRMKWSSESKSKS